ncbi:hypothetical protein WG66_003919 [Moniliophthora roreri]|nr:hypothetical protein WG66_003919 [Moniliophthora roreri]
MAQERNLPTQEIPLSGWKRARKSKFLRGHDKLDAKSLEDMSAGPLEAMWTQRGRNVHCTYLSRALHTQYLLSSFIDGDDGGYLIAVPDGDIGISSSADDVFCSSVR